MFSKHAEITTCVLPDKTLRRLAFYIQQKTGRFLY